MLDQYGKHFQALRHPPQTREPQQKATTMSASGPFDTSLHHDVDVDDQGNIGGIRHLKLEHPW